MTSGQWRAGLIGCGAIGSRYDEGRTHAGQVYTHAGVFASSPQFALACLAEIDERRRAEAGAAWGVPRTYASHRQMLERESLDVVGLATPDDTHAAILEDILELSRPRVVFAEKPLAQSFAQALAIGERYEAAGVVLLVDYVRRQDANHESLRDFLAAGGIGRVHTVCAQYVRGVLHNGCQMVNLLRFLLGEPERVRAFGSGAGGLPGDPSLDLRLEFASGAVAHMVAMDRQGYAYSSFSLEISGDQGQVRLDATGGDIRLERVEPYARFPGFSRLAPAASPWPVETYGQAMLAAGREMARAAAGDVADLKGGWRHAARDVEIIEAAKASAEAHGAEMDIACSRALGPIQGVEDE